MNSSKDKSALLPASKDLKKTKDLKNMKDLKEIKDLKKMKDLKEIKDLNKMKDLKKMKKQPTVQGTQQDNQQDNQQKQQNPMKKRSMDDCVHHAGSMNGCQPLQQKKRKIDVSVILKKACVKNHPSHIEQLFPVVQEFTRMVQMKEGFNEENVMPFGDVEDKDARTLSSLCMVEEGIHYDVDGVKKVFDSAQHLFDFLVHGIPDQVDKWARGGVMSCYSHVFGEEKGNKMKESKWNDFIGIIPFTLVQPQHDALRISLGIELKRDSPQCQSLAFKSAAPEGTSRESTASADATSNTSQNPKYEHYHIWRPVLLSKFSIARLNKLLMGTGSLYLLNRDDVKTIKDDSETGCIVYSKPRKSASEEDRKAYEEKRRLKCREGGKLIGKNRMGRFLMAIRAELRGMDIVRGA